MARTLNQEIERVRRFLSNGIPSDDFSISENEVALYYEAAVASIIPKIAFMGYQVEGVMTLPEGFRTKVVFDTILKDNDTGDGYVTLPSPPIGLPLGYSIDPVTIIGNGKESNPLIPIAAKQLAYWKSRKVKPVGGFYWVLNSTLGVPSDVKLMRGEKLSVVMMSLRDSNRDEPLSLPEDSIAEVFKIVVSQLRERYQLPADNLNDGVDVR